MSSPIHPLSRPWAHSSLALIQVLPRLLFIFYAPISTAPPSLRVIASLSASVSFCHYLLSSSLSPCVSVASLLSLCLSASPPPHLRRLSLCLYLPFHPIALAGSGPTRTPTLGCPLLVPPRPFPGSRAQAASPASAAIRSGRGGKGASRGPRSPSYSRRQEQASVAPGSLAVEGPAPGRRAWRGRRGGSAGGSRVGFGVLPRNEPRHNLSLRLFAELPPERSGAGSQGAKYHKMRRQTLRGGWAAG